MERCKHFISFRDLYRDEKEPYDRGICTRNPIYHNSHSLEFAIVSIENCKHCRFCEMIKEE